MTHLDEMKVQLLIAEINYVEAIKVVLQEFGMDQTWENARLWIERNGPADPDRLEALRGYFP